MLDDRKIKFIELYLKKTDDVTMADIAKDVGVSRTTLWEWLNHDEEVKNEVDRLERQKRILLRHRVANEAGSAFDVIVDLAHNADLEKTKLDAAQYIVNRYDGNPTAKVEQVINKNNDGDLSTDLLEQSVNEVDNKTTKVDETQS